MKLGAIAAYFGCVGGARGRWTAAAYAIRYSSAVCYGLLLEAFYGVSGVLS